jgi:hypothetical protein
MALRLHRAATVRVVWALVAMATTGCVTVYQPLVGLQRPIAVDPQTPSNFTDTRVHLRCHPGEAVEPDVLCRNLRSSLSKQGATVTTEVVRPAGKLAVADSNDSPPQFIIDVTSKLLAREDNPLLTIANIMSFTLVPAVFETTYGQEFRIRDAQGFVLAQQAFQERFVQSFGLGVWALNGILDLVARPKSEQVTGDGAKEEFTKDLHGHLAQLLYNARVKTRVMNSFSPDTSVVQEKPKGAAP